MYLRDISEIGSVLSRGIITIIGLGCFPIFGFAAVSINEVLFDPAGPDTGNEWIELYNSGAETVDLSGWQLYPDGAGYYTFPAGFQVEGSALVTVHLRTSGEDSEKDLHHSAVTGNMGNSSGSVALFGSGERGKETIKAFFRYQKPGSSERKTWEGAAVDAGLWQAGTFLNISSVVSEGSSMGLAQDGVTSGGNAAWNIYGTPTKGLSNSTAAVEAEDVLASNPLATTPLRSMLRLDAVIATHGVATAGASHRFEVRAFGGEGKPVTGDVRYLWNFGDGEITESQTALHMFHFPGEYRVSVNVNTGAALGTAYMDIRVRENSVRLSEILPGMNGFVELSNTSGDTIDIGGWMVEEVPGNHFTMPSDTKMKSGGFLVLANGTTGLLMGSSSGVFLRYPNLRIADQATIIESSGVKSTAKRGAEWAVTDPTPGRGESISSALAKATPVPPSRGVEESPSGVLVDSQEPDDLAYGAGVALASDKRKGSEPGLFNANWFYIFVFMVAVLGGGGAIFLRRMLMKSDDHLD